MYELPEAEWLEYFDSLAFADDDVLVTVAVIRGRSVERPAARTLKAIGYDPGSNVLEIVADGCIPGEATLRYFIAAARRIEITRSDGTGTILVEDASRMRTLISLFNMPHAGSRDHLQAPMTQVTSHNLDGERYV